MSDMMNFTRNVSVFKCDLISFSFSMIHKSISDFSKDLIINTMTVTDDCTHRYPETGLSVLIVGAGVAGLMAALECWRNGHNVRIVERSPEEVTTGK